MGISASGKSTYAKQLITEGYIRINRDDFRKSLINTSLKDYWSGPKEYRTVIEDLVTQMSSAALVGALKSGQNVVVDNTHLRASYVSDILKLCKANCGEQGFEYYIKTFHGIDIKDCIERDGLREDSVGEAVIRNQAEQFKKFRYEKSNQWVSYEPPKFEPLVFDPTKPKCLIVDIDNTVAKMGDRSPFDWKRVGIDEPKQAVIDIVRHIIKKDGNEELDDIKLIFMSGRDEVCRKETEQWLMRNIDSWDGWKLYMRPQNDMRKDDIVKYELLKDHVLPNYNPIAIIDDRNAVVAMWRKVGLTCFQCDYGDF